ncbi:MAG: general secretion pathway protein GspB [Nevskiaceae bacterium]
MPEATPSSSLLPGALALAMLAGAAAAAAQGFGDPTRPTSMDDPAPVRRAESGPRWRLQSTLVAEDRRLAIVNGRTVRPGDRVDGATVREVRQDGVTLEVEGRRIELRLLGAVDVKRDAGG